MTDTEYLKNALDREPTEDENYRFTERVGILLCNSGGAGEDWAQFESFNQIYGAGK